GRRGRALGAALYAAWAYAVVGLAFLPVWTAVVVLPGLGLRRRSARLAARAIAFLLGIPLRLTGAEHLAAGGPRLVAVNHQSYLDGVVLTALLPPDFGFVVKRELEGNLFSRLLLRRLGALFVERFDPAQGVGEARKALDAVRAGGSLAVFVEG